MGIVIIESGRTLQSVRYSECMRQDPDFFGEVELSLIYVAKKLKEALRLEQLLTEAGVDYLVEPDKYSGGIIFRTERVGAFFYVAPDHESMTREMMQRGGFTPYDLN